MSGLNPLQLVDLSRRARSAAQQVPAASQVATETYGTAVGAGASAEPWEGAAAAAAAPTGDDRANGGARYGMTPAADGIEAADLVEQGGVSEQEPPHGAPSYDLSCGIDAVSSEAAVQPDALETWV